MTEATPRTGFIAGLMAMPRWRLATLIGSITLMLGGLCMLGIEQMRSDPAPEPTPWDERRGDGEEQPGTRGASPSPLSLAPTGPAQPRVDEDGEPVIGPDGEPVMEHPPREGLGLWGPVVFRMGFSFFVGFAAGHALRLFFKMGMLIVGVQILILVALQGFGWVSINWDEIRGGYDNFAAWLSGEGGGFTELLTGQLPSAAAGLAGLAIGFKRGA